ncbi:hypothetical protein [Halostella pelagica]|uniref:hypothetical protein n=1 Tax=Halostella pelagica TaxID=2583824 RepID=UPI0010814ACC|nr:hypothetical protein [Halostella pelagica]
MQDRTTADDALESVTDPTAFSDREAIDEVTDSFPHPEQDHCEADYAGRAIVGVTNEEGETLIIVDRDAGAAVLPSPKVETDGDYVAAAKEEVADVAGIDVEITGVERVRHAEHVVEGEDDPFDETTHLVFSATPADEYTEASVDGDESWTVEWHDTVPADLLDDDAPPSDDVRLFVD